MKSIAIIRNSEIIYIMKVQFSSETQAYESFEQM